jgi:hypothetical protein
MSAAACALRYCRPVLRQNGFLAPRLRDNLGTPYFRERELPSVARFANAVLLSLSISLSGCAYYTPKPGETIHVRVVGKLTIEAISSDSNTLAVGNALAHGATRDDIKDGWIAFGTCAQKTDTGLVERHWTIKLPRGEKFVIGTQTSEFAEIYPRSSDERGRLGEFVKKTATPSPDEWRSLPYRSKIVACDAAATPGAIRVEMTGRTNGWSLDQYDTVQSWIRALPKEPLENGRLFIASCAVGTEAWLEWYIQAGPDQAVQVGDVVVARAGNEVSAGGGPLSQVTGPAGDNLKTEKMFGGRSVRCSQQ